MDVEPCNARFYNVSTKWLVIHYFGIGDFEGDLVLQKGMQAMGFKRGFPVTAGADA